MLAIQLSGLDPIQAICIDRNRWRPIWHAAIGKTFDTACLAEEVANCLFIEQILRKLRLARFQMKVIARRKRKNEPHSLTSRAVTSHGVVQVNIDFVPDGATLAPTFVM